MYSGKIPFRQDGELINYISNIGVDRPWIVWKDNYIFEAKMKFDGFSRGRSAANANLIDENNKKYTLFLTDLSLLLCRSFIKDGFTDKIKWTFCKRGTNYGIMPVFD